ncbi:hypothetical protein [Georhizobium sp. MAB10]|uniref:hypothetical protein n=1 Tax=Georhizobium sp. MAB10 TaxID=3028319 RepID=UPI003855D5C7
MQKAIILAASALGRFIDSFQEFENRQTSSLQTRLTDISKERLDIENRILQAREDQASLSENARSLGFGERGDGDIRRMREESDALLQQEREILTIIEERRKAASSTRTELPDFVPPETPENSGRSRAPDTSSIERERDAVRKLIADLQEELTLVYATEEAKRAAASSRQAGAAATDEERRQVVALNEQIYRETEALEAVEAARKDFADGMDQLSTDAVDALGNVIAGTEDAADAFKKLAIEIVKSALTGKGAYSDLFAALGKGGGNGGGGGVGGLLSAIFGGAPAFKTNTTYGSFIGAPGFANGTDSAPGGLAWVGERGKELVNLPRGSQVIANHDLSGLGGSSISAPVSISIDARGADSEGLARVQGQLSRLEAELPARITRQVQQMPRDRIKGY